MLGLSISYCHQIYFSIFSRTAASGKTITITSCISHYQTSRRFSHVTIVIFVPIITVVIINTIIFFMIIMIIIIFTFTILKFNKFYEFYLMNRNRKSKPKMLTKQGRTKISDIVCQVQEASNSRFTLFQGQ